MPTFPEQGWMTAFQERVNEDPEMAVVGKRFAANMNLAFGDVRYVLGVRSGKIERITADPKFDVSTDFSMRAPLDIWRKFVSDDPPPLFHDFFAMLMRVPDFILEGNTLVAMQNARALHRMMNLMQKVGE